MCRANDEDNVLCIGISKNCSTNAEDNGYFINFMILTAHDTHTNVHCNSSIIHDTTDTNGGQWVQSILIVMHIYIYFAYTYIGIFNWLMLFDDANNDKTHRSEINARHIT